MCVSVNECELVCECVCVCAHVLCLCVRDIFVEALAGGLCMISLVCVCVCVCVVWLYLESDSMVYSCDLWREDS